MDTILKEDIPSSGTDHSNGRHLPQECEICRQNSIEFDLAGGRDAISVFRKQARLYARTYDDRDEAVSLTFERALVKPGRLFAHFKETIRHPKLRVIDLCRWKYGRSPDPSNDPLKDEESRIGSRPVELSIDAPDKNGGTLRNTLMDTSLPRIEDVLDSSGTRERIESIVKKVATDLKGRKASKPSHVEKRGPKQKSPERRVLPRRELLQIVMDASIRELSEHHQVVIHAVEKAGSQEGAAILLDMKAPTVRAAYSRIRKKLESITGLVSEEMVRTGLT